MSTTQSSTPENIKSIVVVLLTGAFMAILNQTLLTTALPHIMSDLGITADMGQWLNSAFMLVNGVMIPITAFLIEKFTTRKLFFTAMGLFTLGTLLCALAPNFAFLIGGRIIQAAGAGIMLPLMQTVLLLMFPIERRGFAMGMVGLVIAFAPAIGPTLSGWLVEQYHWSILFWIIFPLALIDMIVSFWVLKNVSVIRNPRLDLLSIILSTLGFGGLLYGFSSAGTYGWAAPHVTLPMIIGVITLGLFVWRQLILPQPILEVRVFKYGVFTLATIIGMIIFMSMIGSQTILPIYMQDMHDFTAFETGLMLLPGAVAMGLMSPITGRIFDRFGARKLSIIGLLLVCVTTFMFTQLSTTTSLAYLAIVNAIRFFGMSLVMMPITTAAVNSLPNVLIPHGTAMNNTMRQVAGAIGTALLVTVMSTMALAPEEIDGNINEGMVHGVNMAFWLAAILTFIGLILSFFIPRGKAMPPDNMNAREDLEGE
ncbi:EmrB/QacA subfamily drug resistance transporter [Geomicrobium halophilum]|uniref:EmrB/QacA subfamily drug resistance transporter n=1 Tax=Geomicrobium halophilum TaxID=549000 RepID=A0A841Q067_9BACL|nr:MDR family MFS transporter [Geomicrobium halophilum]MBB6450722.1 EmrB/QacA subfamily drug resistance transporter [Geomicrobium halophilum]